MKIGSIIKQRNSGIEGDNIAVVHVSGCNFKCRFCHNPIPDHDDMPDHTPDTPNQAVIDFFRLNRNSLSEVYITGGEPTLQNDLPAFLIFIRSLGLRIKIKTNGTNPEMLQKIIRMNLADNILMDVKAGFSSDEYEKITGVPCDDIVDKVLRSILLIKDSGISHEFYTVIDPEVHTDASIDEIQSFLAGSSYIKQKMDIDE